MIHLKKHLYFSWLKWQSKISVTFISADSRSKGPPGGQLQEKAPKCSKMSQVKGRHGKNYMKLTLAAQKVYMFLKRATSGKIG